MILDDASVAGHGHADIVAQRADGLGQRANDVGQPSRLGERYGLGGQQQDI